MSKVETSKERMSKKMTFTLSLNVFVWEFRSSFLDIFSSDVFNAYFFDTWWSLDDSP